MTTERQKKTELTGLMVAKVTSTFGDQFTTLASFCFLLKSTGNPITASSSLLIKAAIQLIFGLASMKVLDRLPRKPFILGSDLLRAFLVATLALVPLSSIYYVLAIQGICSVLEILFRSARESYFLDKIECLEPKSQSRFTAIDLWLDRTAEVAGYALSFILVSYFSYQTSYIIDSVTFLFAFFTVLFISSPLESKEECQSPQNTGIRDGIQAVLSSEVLLRSTLTRALFWGAGGIFNMLMLKIASELITTYQPTSLVAIWDAILTIGMIFGILLAGRLPWFQGRKLFYFCGLGNSMIALSILSLAFLQHLYVLALMMSIYGLGMGFNSFGLRSLRAQFTSKETRGRAIAFTEMVANLTQIFGMLFVIFYSYLGTSKLLYASAFIMGLSAWIATLSGLSPYRIIRDVAQEV